MGKDRARARPSARGRARIAATLTMALAAASVAGADPGSAATRDASAELRRAFAGPRIDGRLDDPFWRAAARAADFTLFHPRPGERSDQETEVLWARDGESLCFAFRCRDARPEALRARVARRDSAFDDDWAGVILDPEGDGAGAVELLVTAGGSQIDAFVSGCGGDDLGRDFVFRSAVARDSHGWSAELAVPLRSLPLAASGDGGMRFFALRHIARSAERLSHPPIDPTSPRWLASGAPLGDAPRRGLGRIDLLPAVTLQGHRRRDPGGPLRAEAPRAEAGGTLIVSWAGRLTAALALRPDFSAVESDAPQVMVNRRFPVFYPEKRPFFLEGAECFELAAEGGPLPAVFHSRAIVAPSLGLRADGRFGPRDRLSALYADDGGALGILRWRHGGEGPGHVGLYAAASDRPGERGRLLGADGLLLPRSDLRIRFLGLFSRAGCEEGRCAAEARAGHAGALRADLSRRGGSVGCAYAEVNPRFAGAASFVERRGVREASLEGRRLLHPASSRWRRLEAGLRGRSAWSFAGRATDAELALRASAEALGGLCLSGELALAGERVGAIVFDASGWELAASGARRGPLLLDAGLSRRAVPWYAAGGAEQASRALVWGRAQLTLRADCEIALEAWQARFQRSGDGRPLAREAAIWGCLRLQASPQLALRALVDWRPGERRLTSDWLCAYGGPLGPVLQVGYGSLHAPSPARAAAAKETSAPGAEAPQAWLACQRDFFVKLGWSLRLGGSGPP